MCHCIKRGHLYPVPKSSVLEEARSKVEKLRNRPRAGLELPTERISSKSWLSSSINRWFCNGVEEFDLESWLPKKGICISVIVEKCSVKWNVWPLNFLPTYEAPSRSTIFFVRRHVTLHTTSSRTNFGIVQNPIQWELGLQILISYGYVCYVWCKISRATHTGRLDRGSIK